VELQEYLGITAANLDDKKFRHYVETIEREFGVRLRDQQFREFIETGRLELDLIDMEWRNTIAERKELHDWMLGTEGLELQAMLGMTQMELDAIIAGHWVDVERQKIWLDNLQFNMGLEWDKEKFDKVMRENAKDRSNSFWTSVFTAAMTGVGYGYGGAAGGAAGATTAETVIPE